jgi:tetratricopeptide (TPR) repeat protein
MAVSKSKHENEGEPILEGELQDSGTNLIGAFKKLRNPRINKNTRRFSSPEAFTHPPSSMEGESQSKAMNQGGDPLLRSLPSPSTGRHRHPKVRMARHTMDTTRGTVDEEGTRRRGSLFHRMFANRKNSKNGSSSTGTSSKCTDDSDLDPLALDGNSPAQRNRRATMDTVGVKEGKGPTSIESKGGTASTEAPSGFAPRPASQLKMSGTGPRRATMDLVSSNHGPKRSRRMIMRQDDYQEEQRRLQRMADDYAKGGDLESAIELWVQAFHLAEEQQDSLAAKTELMCTLLGLHMQSVWMVDPGLTDEASERQRRFHKGHARRYLTRIKPALVQPSWFVPTRELIEFFMDNEAWELALTVAEHIIKFDGMGAAMVVVPLNNLARLHFEVAKKKAEVKQQGDALQHLQSACKYLQETGPAKDESIYVNVLHLLATEYSSQGQYALSLEALQEQLAHTPSKNRAFLHVQIATDVYIPMNKLDLALEQLQEASALLDLEVNDGGDTDLYSNLNDDPDAGTEAAVRLKLLQTKADVLFRLGNMEQSLKVYERALTAVNRSLPAVNPADKAKILYTMGRLCVKLRQPRKAIGYFTEELEITQATLGYHLSVSRVLHELARLYDEGLGDYRMALAKYKEAYRVEYKVLEQCQLAIPNCESCAAKRRMAKKESKKPNSEVVNRPCTAHFNLQRDVAQQIRETKKCQGRLHFKLGDFQKALQTSMPPNAMGAGTPVARKPAPQSFTQ